MLSPDLTEDSLLGGRVRLRQPQVGLRAGHDAVLLAAAVPARPGERVLELGCGSGAAFLCLAARVPDLDIVAVEREPALAALARDNAELLAMSGPRNPYGGRLGVVEEGALADLLLVDGDPLANLSLVATPETSFVVIMKDGKVYKNLLSR